MKINKTIVVGAAAAASSGGAYVVGAIAAFGLPKHEYAEFSNFYAWVMLLALVFDFGIGQATLREFGRGHSADIFRGAIALKIGVAAVLIVSVSATYLWHNDAILVAMVIAATLLSLNTTLRIYQAHAGDYRGLLISSSLLVATSVAGSAVALLSARWTTVAIAAIVLPGAVAFLGRVSTAMRLTGARRYARTITRHAPSVYLSGLAFAGIVPVALVIMRTRMTASEFATLALALSLSGALSLITTSFRTAQYADFGVLLAEGGAALDRLARFGRLVRPFLAVYTAAAVGLLVLTALVYESKYAGVTVQVATLAAGFGATALVGLYNIRAQVMGFTRVEALLNATRLAAAVLVSMTIAPSRLSAAAGIALTLALFELLYAVVTEWRVHRTLVECKA